MQRQEQSLQFRVPFPIDTALASIRPGRNNESYVHPRRRSELLTAKFQIYF